MASICFQAFLRVHLLHSNTCMQASPYYLFCPRSATSVIVKALEVRRDQAVY